MVIFVPCQLGTLSVGCSCNQDPFMFGKRRQTRQLCVSSGSTGYVAVVAPQIEPTRHSSFWHTSVIDLLSLKSGDVVSRTTFKNAGGEDEIAIMPHGARTRVRSKVERSPSPLSKCKNEECYCIILVMPRKDKASLKRPQFWRAYAPQS